MNVDDDISGVYLGSENCQKNADDRRTYSRCASHYRSGPQEPLVWYAGHLLPYLSVVTVPLGVHLQEPMLPNSVPHKEAVCV